MHWILFCALFVAVNSFSVKGNIVVRNQQNSSIEESMLDDVLSEFQGICYTDISTNTATKIKKDTQKIVNNVVMYKDIVKLNKQLKDDVQWIIKESGDEQLVLRLLKMIKRDAKDTCEELEFDCTELGKYKLVSGVYKIYPDLNVYCDMTTDGGGWTIIQRRIDGSVNFQRNWTDYENGFGNVNGEYWLGNKHIHSLTSSVKYELRIDLADATNYAVYKTFVVGDAASKYKLTIGDYSGDAGNYMAYNNNKLFSTTDRKNDPNGSKCVDSYGPWWHYGCTHSALNRKFKSKLFWSSLNNVKTSVMMIRKLK